MNRKHSMESRYAPQEPSQNAASERRAEQQIVKGTERKAVEQHERSLHTEKHQVEQRLRLAMADDVADRRNLSPAERGMVRTDALRAKAISREGNWQPDNRHVDWQDFRSEDQAVRKVTDYLRQEDTFRPEKWRTAKPLERELALNRLSQACERAHGVAGPLDVRGADLTEQDGLIERGNFNPEEWGTEVNHKLLESDDPRAAIEVTLHEFRHAMHETVYQRGVRPPYSDGTDVLPNSTKVDALRHNRDRYVNPLDADKDPTGQAWQRYEGQPYEKEARAYARHVMQEWQAGSPEA